MADPERLLEGGTDFERALLEGARTERPSRKLSRQMAMGIGLGAGLTYASTAKALMQTFWGKAAVAVGVSAGVAGVVALTTVNDPGFQEQYTGSPAGVEAPAPAPKPPLVELPPEAPSEPAANSQSASADKPRPGAVTQAKRRENARAESTLSEEVRMLDRARALVHRGDHAAALRVLRSYEQRYPQGVLRREAGVLRARAAK